MSETPDPHSKSTETDTIPLKALAAEKAGVLHPDDSVKTAGDRMRKHDAHEWPVAEGRKLVGAVDEKNPDWKICGHGHDPKAWQVGQIMNRKVHFCFEDEDCASAQKIMDENGLRYLPVVDRQMRIVGIFSREEIDQKTDASGDGISSI